MSLLRRYHFEEGKIKMSLLRTYHFGEFQIKMPFLLFFIRHKNKVLQTLVFLKKYDLVANIPK